MVTSIFRLSQRPDLNGYRLNTPLQTVRPSFRAGKGISPELLGRAAGLPILLLVLMLVGGCSLNQSIVHPQAQKPYIYGNYPKTIAILPFINHTRSDDIADMLRIVFYCHLSVHPFNDIELHVVDEKLKMLDVSDAAAIQQMPARQLGALLGADAVIMGEIEQFERVFLGIYSQLSLGASIVVVDTRSGQKIWDDQYTVRIHEGGVPFTLFEIPFVTLRSGLNLSDKAKIRAADDLSRHLALRIPAPHIPDYSNRVAATCPVSIGAYLFNTKEDDEDEAPPASKPHPMPK